MAQMFWGPQKHANMYTFLFCLQTQYFIKVSIGKYYTQGLAGFACFQQHAWDTLLRVVTSTM